MGLRIKKNDTAVVITGRNKGAKGRVLSVATDKNRIIIEGVNVVKKHMKPNKQYQQGGIIEKESSLHLSNVMLVCPKCDKPTRIAHKLKEVEISGEKKQKSVRVCKKCGKVID